MKPTSRSFLALAIALAFITTFSLLSYAEARGVAQPTARITQQIDESKMLKLAGNTRPEAKNILNDRGAVPDSLYMEHMFLLLQRSPEKEKELEQLIDSLNDRNSRNFHHWLTPEEFGEYGAAPEDITTVTNWLASHGFYVEKVYRNRMLIDISGTAGQIRAAFGTEIHQLDVNGEQHIANISDPHIPAALAPVVKGFASLNDFRPHANYRSITDYTYAGCASSSAHPSGAGTCYAITPQDDAVIYNVNPLWSAGYSGQGQTIAVVEDSDVYTTNNDFGVYRSTFGLASAFPSGNLVQVHPGCSDPGTNADDGEAAIDVEMATTFAPSATIENLACPSPATGFGGLIALTNLVDGAGPYPGVVSVSYGVCEAFNGNGGNQAFYNTYEQAAAEGISVFGATGDEGPSSCSLDFSIGTEYDVASLGVTGWTETPYNVAVGGTDFEDTYNVKKASGSFSTYWSPTNTSTYGSALSYIPEIPWNDSCASVLIANVADGSFVPYGTGTHACNQSPYDKTSGYMIAGAASGGASNCATGAGGTNQGEYGITDLECQGWPKPSWQSAYGVPTDGLRDIPDVSLFAANGLWSHYQVVCWSDPSQTSGGATASCSGLAPSSWSGFGGTSVASPSLAAIQALVNQKTAETWGNPNPIYYKIGQTEYGTQGGSFLGSTCNSSGVGGPASSCVFNDITQGDIDVACEDNGTIEEAHCYKPSGTYGVDSTDNVTAAVVLWGGTGYTSAPTCTIAGPTNNQPYKSPTGTTLWVGGTQATCTATVSASTTTAVWTVLMDATSGVGDTIILENTDVGGSTTCGPYTLTGTTTALMCSNLASAIGSGCSLASATCSSSTDTITAKAAGAAGNFITEFGTATEFNNFYVYVTNTTKGQGPNYVSGIAIGTAGTGYQPQTPITLGGPGTGAVAVANTSFGTAAQSYQPAYGAAPGYDLATGLGSVNAYNLVQNCAWFGCQQNQTITCGTSPPSSEPYGNQFPVACTATSTLTVAFTASGGCSVVDNDNDTATYTMTSSTATCNVIVNQAGNGSWNPAPTVTDPVSATTANSSTGLTANPQTIGTGDTTTLTATVTGAPYGAAPTGYVTFYNGATQLGSPCLLGGGGCTGSDVKKGGGKPISVAMAIKPVEPVMGNHGKLVAQTATATMVVSGIPLGTNSNIYASYGGDTNYNTSPSSPVTVTVVNPGIYAPTPGSTLAGNSATFSWYGAAGATAYWIDVGPAPFGNTYYSSGSLPTSTESVTVNSLPTDGSTVCVTLYWYLGGSWVPNQYTYTAYSAGAVTGVLTTPTPGSTLPGSQVTLGWTAGSGASAYWVDVSAIGQGGNDLDSSGNLGNVTSWTVYNMPTTGGTVYVTLYSLVGSQWIPNYYTYTAYNAVAATGIMQTPTPGSTLPGSTVTFTWSAGAGASGYWVDVSAIGQGGNDLDSSGNLGNVLTETVYNMPTSGGTVYVTLYTLIGSQWIPSYYTYTAYSGAPGVLNSPTPGSTLTGSTVTLGWAAGSGVSGYWVDISAIGQGGNDLDSSGNLGNVLTETVYNMPTNGGTVYVTLYSLIGSQWVANYYTYTAFNGNGALAVMTTPNPLSGSTVTFNWTSDPSATAYWVDISAVGPGGNDLDSSGNLGNVLTETVYNMPADGSTVYVTLYSYVGGQWLSTAATYTSNP